ncbi:MAG: multidrug effflux MFS transporter [Alcanivoracaceae bacterium]|nr:multidrug effflux MFS transporter [Alcanivoracaceae bacterium]
MSETASPQITRLRLALALGPLIAVGPLAIDTYLPALPAMADSYGVRVTEVERSISLYVMGTALGQLLGGPLSDHLGRKPVAWGGLLLFALASLLISLSTALWQLDLLRMIQALGGGATVVVAAASVRDWFDGQEAARVLSNIGLIMLIAPLVAPAVGAMLVLLQGWQAIFIGLAGYALVMMVWVAKVMPTHIPVAVDRRLSDVAKGWGRVLSHRQAMAIILANGLSFSTLFAFITDSAFVYLRFYGVSETAFPLLFGANVATMILFNRINMLLLRRIPAIRLMTAALILQVSAAWLLLLAVLILGKPPLWLLVPLIMLAGGAVAMVIPNAIACFTHYFPHDSGAATGINGSLQFFLAGMTGILMTSLHNHSLLPLAIAMALAASLALTLLRRGRAGPA